MFPYGESKEKWDKLVDLLVKYNIYLEIIRIVKDTQSQQGAPISETGGEEQLDTVREIIENETKFEFLGKQYVFRDVQAIQSAVTNPTGFLGDTFLTSGESAKDFKNEDIVLLYNNNDGFYPREDINDIRLLLTTMRNINGKGGLSVLWDPSRLSSDTGNIRSTDLELITGRLDDLSVTQLYFPNDPDENIPTNSLGAPKFEEVVGQNYTKMGSASAQAIPKINDLFVALAKIMEPHLQEPLLEEKYRRLYKEVLDAIRADLFSAAVEGKVLEAVAPAESNVHQERFDELARLAPDFGVRSLTPFDFQCFLMENIGIIADKQEKLKAATKVSEKPEAYHAIDPYKFIIPLKGEPGTVISKINHGAKTAEVKMLMDLDPTVYAMLVPYIKIYRIDYDKKSPSKPIRQMELPIPNFLDPSDISQLTGKGSGRYKGFGLKSFNWRLDGTQPATVDNNISANLKFYFQSINDLFQGSLAAGQAVPNPLDLLISPETIDATDPKKKKEQDAKAKPKNCSALKDNLHQKYDGANFRIKVVAGWSTPPNLNALLPSWEQKKINLLKRAIDSTRITLYLHQVRHNLNFKQNGAVELSIDYQAALTGILQNKQADILGASDENLIVKTKGLENRQKKIKADIDELLEDKLAGKDVEESVKSQKEKLKKVVEEIKELENEDRLRKYGRFLQNLYESGKIYVAEVPTGEILREPLGEIADPEERASRALQRLSTDPRKRGYKLFEQADLDPEAPRHATRGQTDIRDVIAAGIEKDTTSVKEVGATADKTIEDQWSSPRLSDADVYIPYFYLGDLIDTIFARNREYFIANKIDTGYMTFLSDVDVTDPLKLFQVKNIMDISCADSIDDALLLERLKEEGIVAEEGSIRKRINIGSIPISLDQFNVWFKDNVIKKEKNSYYLLHFMKDICNGLIAKALGASCFKNDPVNFLRFDTSIVHFNNQNKKIKNGVSTTVNQLAIQKGALNENNDIPSANATEEQKRNYSSVSGLVLYCTDAKPKSRDGNYLDDLSSGIYHNYIGSAAGLVKSINFDRVDQKGLREAKIEKRGALGAEQLRELYTARLSMIGNTLFKNGQYTFIWPTLVSSDDKYATLLGLGGYFMIVSVDHSITTKGYDVTVKALQQGLRFDKTGAVVAEVYSVQPTDPAPDLAEWMQARGLGEEDTQGPPGALEITAETPEVSRQNIAIANAYAQGTRPPG